MVHSWRVNSMMCPGNDIVANSEQRFGSLFLTQGRIPCRRFGLYQVWWTPQLTP